MLRRVPSAFQDPLYAEHQAEAGINRPGNVVELARKFSAAFAQQEQLRYKMEKFADVTDANQLSSLVCMYVVWEDGSMYI